MIWSTINLSADELLELKCNGQNDKQTNRQTYKQWGSDPYVLAFLCGQHKNGKKKRCGQPINQILGQTDELMGYMSMVKLWRLN